MKKILIIIGSALILLTVVLVIVISVSKNKGLVVNVYSNHEEHQVKKIKLASSEDFNLPDIPEIAGFLFDGWYFDQESTNPYSKEKLIALFKESSTIDLYANWIEALYHEVIFYIEDESNTFEVLHNTTLRNVIDDPVKEGFIFVGWLFDNEIYDLDNLVTRNLLLDAVFEPIETYTVILNLDGGLGLDNTYEVYDGSLLELPHNPTKVGYNFVSWQYQSNEFDFNMPITKNIVITAIWEIKMLTISFDIEGVLSSEQVEYGTHVNELDRPNIEGLDFLYWEDITGNTFNDFLIADITLFAVFDDLVYWTISFDTEGGTNLDDILVLDGNLMPETLTTKEGFKFRGWWSNDINNAVIPNETVIFKDMHLVAEWEALLVITFDYNNPNLDIEDILITELIVESGSSLTGLLPTMETDEGIIIGWKYLGQDYFGEAVDHDSTFVAVWEWFIVPIYNVTLIIDFEQTITDTVVFEEGELFTYPEPTNLGFTFGHWLHNGQVFNEGTPVTEDMILESVWFAVFHNVTYIYNDPITNDEIIVSERLGVNEGTSYNFFNFPIEKDDVTYAKIFMDQELTIPIDLDGILTNDLTLYVRPLLMLTVDFTYNDELYKRLSILEGSFLTEADFLYLNLDDMESIGWLDQHEELILPWNTLIEEDKVLKPIMHEVD